MGLIQTDRATQHERPLGEQEKKLLVDNAHQRFQNSNAFAINIKYSICVCTTRKRLSLIAKKIAPLEGY
jgi:hypothetical protein